MELGLILSLAVLILSIIAHEVAHGYAANALGDPTARLAGRLTLNPIPHVDLMGSILLPALLLFSGSPILFGWAKPVPYNPFNLRSQRWGEAAVAVAGSATNLLLAIIFGLLVRATPSLGLNATMTQDVIVFAGTVAFVNLFLALFNLIPFPPLDGFTALRSALPWNLARGLGEFEHRIRSAGVVALILFLLVFVYIFSRPFFAFVLWIFGHLTGG